MPRKTRSQYQSGIVSALKSAKLEPQTLVAKDRKSVWLVTAWHPTEDKQIAVEEMTDGTFLVAVNELVPDPRQRGQKKLMLLGYTSLRSYEETFALARHLGLAMKHGRAKAMRMRPKSEYRLPLPNPNRARMNPANKRTKDRKRADELVARLEKNPRLHNVGNTEVWLFIESTESFLVSAWLDEEGEEAFDFYHDSARPKNKQYVVSAGSSRVPHEDRIIGSYSTYDDGEEAFLLALNTRLYGRAKALGMRPKGEYRAALPNPTHAACWVDEARSNPGDFTTPPTDRAFAAEDHLPKVREKLYTQRGSFGELRGVRLDIPSRMRDLMVVTIHEKPSGGTVVGYDHSAVVKNAEFRVAQGQQAKIMRGEAKAPHAYVSGTLVDETPSTKGTPISFNPRTTHLFLDATNGRPVKSAKRVSIIGKRVYAEGLVHYAPGEAPKKPV